MKVRYSVFRTTCFEGISEIEEAIFCSLSEAKLFVERKLNRSIISIFAPRCQNYILKYVENENGTYEINDRMYKIIKKVHVYERGKWYATRHVSKYQDWMKI